MKENIEKYKKLLPLRINVTIEKNDDGLWAKIDELPFCFTQARSGSELPEMINDAIFTHLGIPEKYRKNVGYYVPITEKHRQLLEDMFRKLVTIEQKISMGKEAMQVFSLTPNAICSTDN